MNTIDQDIEQLKTYYRGLSVFDLSSANEELARKIFDYPNTSILNIYLTAINKTSIVQQKLFPGLSTFLNSPYAIACKHLYEHGLLSDTFKHANFRQLTQHPDPIHMAQMLSFINCFSLLPDNVGLLSDKNRAGADNWELIARKQFDPAALMSQNLPYHFAYKNNLFIQKHPEHTWDSPYIALTPDAIDI